MADPSPLSQGNQDIIEYQSSPSPVRVRKTGYFLPLAYHAIGLKLPSAKDGLEPRDRAMFV